MNTLHIPFEYALKKNSAQCKNLLSFSEIFCSDSTRTLKKEPFFVTNYPCDFSFRKSVSLWVQKEVIGVVTSKSDLPREDFIWMSTASQDICILFLLQPLNSSRYVETYWSLFHPPVRFWMGLRGSYSIVMETDINYLDKYFTPWCFNQPLICLVHLYSYVWRNVYAVNDYYICLHKMFSWLMWDRQLTHVHICQIGFAVVWSMYVCSIVCKAKQNEN